MCARQVHNNVCGARLVCLPLGMHASVVAMGCCGPKRPSDNGIVRLLHLARSGNPDAHVLPSHSAVFGDEFDGMHIEVAALIFCSECETAPARDLSWWAAVGLQRGVGSQVPPR